MRPTNKRSAKCRRCGVRLAPGQGERFEYARFPSSRQRSGYYYLCPSCAERKKGLDALQPFVAEYSDRIEGMFAGRDQGEVVLALDFTLPECFEAAGLMAGRFGERVLTRLKGDESNAALSEKMRAALLEVLAPLTPEEALKNFVSDYWWQRATALLEESNV